MSAIADTRELIARNEGLLAFDRPTTHLARDVLGDTHTVLVAFLDPPVPLLECRGPQGADVTPELPADRK